MSTQAERRALHAYVSSEAHERWHDFAAVQGVSVSAVLEALAGHALANADSELDVNDVMSEVVRTARKLDAERRRRRAKTSD